MSAANVSKGEATSTRKKCHIPHNPPQNAAFAKVALIILSNMANEGMDSYGFLI